MSEEVARVRRCEPATDADGRLWTTLDGSPRAGFEIERKFLSAQIVRKLDELRMTPMHREQRG
jgi:hypothetical protein